MMSIGSRFDGKGSGRWCRIQVFKHLTCHEMSWNVLNCPFRSWINHFLPQILQPGFSLEPGRVTQSHLDLSQIRYFLQTRLCLGFFQGGRSAGWKACPPRRAQLLQGLGSLQVYYVCLVHRGGRSLQVWNVFTLISHIRGAFTKLADQAIVGWRGDLGGQRVNNWGRLVFGVQGSILISKNKGTIVSHRF